MSDLSAFVQDGPAFGHYPARRLAQRMVFTVAPNGNQYVLDEPGDTVEPDEQAYIYEAGGVLHLCGDQGCGREITYLYAGQLDPVTGEFLPADPEVVEQIREEGKHRVRAWAREAVEAHWAEHDQRDDLPGIRQRQTSRVIRVGPKVDEAAARAAAYIQPESGATGYGVHDPAGTVEPYEPLALDLQTAGTIRPINRLVPAPPATEADLAELLIEDRPLRMAPGTQLRTLGDPKVPCKLLPKGRPTTTIRRVDEKAGGYWVDRWEGSCTVTAENRSFITFTAADLFWLVTTSEVLL